MISGGDRKMATAFSNADRAEVLTQALPYFKKYYGKTVVVKYGGNAMLTEDLQQQVMEDIVLLHLVGVRVVLVHGGGPEITGMLKRVGKESQFVNGLRVTDKETVEIAQMVLAGKINKTLVTYLEAKGGSAIGLSGMDGRMITAKMNAPPSPPDSYSTTTVEPRASSRVSGRPPMPSRACPATVASG